MLRRRASHPYQARNGTMKLSDDHSPGFVVPEHNKTETGPFISATRRWGEISFGDVRGLKLRVESCLLYAGDIEEHQEML